MADLVHALARLGGPALSRCRIPSDLESVTDRGREDDARDAGTTPDAVEALWERVLALYRAGVHPGIQICVRRHGAIALNRAVGHARGNAPDDPEDAIRVPMTVGTPGCSAASLRLWWIASVSESMYGEPCDQDM